MVTCPDSEHPPDETGREPAAESSPGDADTALYESLPPEIARLLYPERSREPLTVSLVYPQLEESVQAQAAELQAMASCHTFNELPVPGQTPRQRTTFTLQRIEELHQLYHLVEMAVGTRRVEVLLNGQVVPLVRELWLPLLWILRG
ncbi:MAG: hypothetical protein ACE5HV_09665 [Acidobacteriota bacterium]